MSWRVSQASLEGSWAGFEPRARAWVALNLTPQTLAERAEARGLSAWTAWQLSARLAEVARLCPRGLGVVDVGTDHALLPLAMTRSGYSPAALGVDINSAPLAGARRRLTSRDQLTLALADGFLGAQEPIRALWRALGAPQEGLCGCVCGVGGAKVEEMISTLPEQITHLALQPNLQHGRVREALARCGWLIQEERLTLEGGRLFLTLSARRGASSPTQQAHTPTDPLTSAHWPERSQRLKSDPLYPLWLWVHLERERALISRAVEHTSEEARAHFELRRGWASALALELDEALP